MFTAEQKMKAVAMTMNNIPLRKIVTEIGCSEASVRGWIRQHTNHMAKAYFVKKPKRPPKLNTSGKFVRRTEAEKKEIVRRALASPALSKTRFVAGMGIASKTYYCWEHKYKDMVLAENARNNTPPPMENERNFTKAPSVQQSVPHLPQGLKDEITKAVNQAIKTYYGNLLASIISGQTIIPETVNIA